jgi:hypothetical protein
VDPLLLVGLGLVALAAAIVVVRSFGHRYRIGRLLAVTPRVGVAEAVALARAGVPRYVRIEGRIDAETPFEDAAHRPLVWRRTRIERLEGRGWRTLEEDRQVVPFELREGLDAIAVETEALDAGLVVLPRESVGRASELGDRLPAGTPPDAVVRIRIEQISAVEHAIALGVPSLGPDGRVRLAPGLGRDLILTTLEPPEAMRVLVGGERLRPAVAAVLFVVGLLAVAVGAVAGVASLLLRGLGAGAVAAALAVGSLGIGVVRAATPTPSPPVGDPRSPGQGPGFVGEPLLAVGVVLLVAVLAVLATVLYLRLTGGGDGGAAEPR